MLTRSRSMSVNDGVPATPDISIGSPSTVPPARRTMPMASAMLSTEMTTDGVLRRPVGFLREEATVDRARLLDSDRRSRSSSRESSSPFPRRAPWSPAKRLLIEPCHSLLIVVWHFKVDHWVLRRLLQCSGQGRLASLPGLAGQCMKLHDFDGGLRDLQVRVALERLRCRFVRLRLDDRVQHDVVPGV